MATSDVPGKWSDSFEKSRDMFSEADIEVSNIYY
jgi:hypothetical protein